LKKMVFVICGGPIGDLSFLQAERERHEPVCLICADGGARHVHALGLTPRAERIPFEPDLGNASVGSGV